MNGKDKCRILKDIRRQIAENNDIEWIVSECSHKGSCKGTCPKCESEVRKLERELSLRRKFGKAVAITGVSAACVAGLTGCSLEDVADFGQEIVDNIREIAQELRDGQGYIDPGPYVLEGDVPYIAYPEDDLSGMIDYYEDPLEGEAETVYSEEIH